MFDRIERIRQEMISKALSNVRCSSMQACSLFSSHSGRPLRTILSRVFHWSFMQLYRADMWTATLTFYYSTSTTCCSMREQSVRHFGIAKKKSTQTSTLIKFCRCVQQSSSEGEAKWENNFKLHQNFILILLPQPSRRAPTLNQYCFSSSSIVESIDSERISNYRSRELRNTRELAAVLQHSFLFPMPLPMAAASCCIIIILKKLCSVKTSRWWRSKRF